MECLLPYLCMVTVPHIMVGLERMLDYRDVGLARFHCTYFTYTLYAYVHAYKCMLLTSGIVSPRDLKTREKIVLLHRICHWRLELDDIGDTLRVS